MKVSLIVASGVHQGKVIPMTGTQFVIGRDPECHLRPASQAVSKKHCAVVIRDGQVFLKDFGSTNGTVLNDGIVQNEEQPLKNNDLVKIGPLDFTVRVEQESRPTDGTPLPEANPVAVAAIAAVKATVGGPSAKAPPRDATPVPAAAGKPAAKPAPKPAPTKSNTPAPKPAAAEGTGDAEHDRLAAMLLGLEDGDVPGGSTVVDMPLSELAAASAPTESAPQSAQDKTNARIDEAKKKAQQANEDSSSAASEILRRYMRRPK